MAITQKVSQRVRAWVDLMDDLSGRSPSEEDWFTPDEAREALTPFLKEIGRTYTPAMIANAKAVMAGETSFDTEIDGRPWTQPTFKYQAKCVQWLRESHAALSDNERGSVDALLQGTGCEALFATES